MNLATVVDLLARMVKPFEGLAKLVGDMVHPYICPAGYPTQGFGLLVRDMSVPAITPGEAEKRLYAAMPYYVREAVTICPALLRAPPDVIAAVADFVFNLGPAKFRSSTFKRMIDAWDWVRAREECLRWVNGGGRRLSGLVRRRAMEVEVMRLAMERGDL